MDDDIKVALSRDETVDITTTGRKSGAPSRIEIWFRRVNGRYYITGIPGARDWYANLLANPRFIFHLKQTIQADLSACARPITDPDERQRVISAPEMVWYQDQVNSLEELVQGSPIVEVLFED